MSGIYFMKYVAYADRNIYKVGFSENLKKRLSSYNVMAVPGDNFKFDKIITSEQYTKNRSNFMYFEKRCHTIWKKYRLGNTELFEVDNFKLDFQMLINELTNSGMKIIIHEKIPKFRIRFKGEENKLDYSYQIPKVNKIMKFFCNNNRGMIVYPPGMGKTFIAGKIFHKFRNVVIFVPQILIADEFLKMCKVIKPICEQNENELFNIEVINSDYISAKDMQKISNGQIKIITYQSYEQCKDKLIDVDLVVYDEAHHTCSQIFGRTLELKSCKKLFMTATPKIPDEVDLRVSIIDKVSIRDCIDRSMLSDYRLLVFNECSLLDMVNELINKHHRKKIIIFFNKRNKNELIRKGKLFSKLLNDNKIKSFDLHGGSTKLQKIKILKEFQEKGIKVICNVNMISEGVSLPCADSMIFAEPRMSSIGVIQNIGRVLRKSPEKDISLICLPPKMSDVVNILNVLYNNDDRLRSLKSGMIIGNSKNIDKIEQILNLIEISKKGGIWEYKLRVCLDYEKSYGWISNKTVHLDTKIGGFLSNNRTNYKSGTLKPERLELLKQLDSWKERERDKWTENYLKCVEYEKNNILTVTTEYKGNIGSWLSEQFKKIKKGPDHNISKIGKVTDKQKILIMELTVWKRINDSRWTNVLDKLIVEENKIGIIKGKKSKYGAWLSQQKVKYNKEKLTDIQITLLKKSITWQDRMRDKWKDNYNLCVEFEGTGFRRAFPGKLENNSNYMKNSLIYKDEPIGLWFSEQMKFLVKCKMSETRTKMIKMLSTCKTRMKRNWKTNYKLCLEFETVNKSVVNEDTVYKNFDIGVWFNIQLTAESEGSLSEKKRLLLNELSSCKAEIKPQDIWMEWYNLCIEHIKNNDSIIKQLTKYNGKCIGQWYLTQLRKQNKLSTVKKDLLKKLKMTNNKTKIKETEQEEKLIEKTIILNLSGANNKKWMKKYNACLNYETNNPTEFITRFTTDNKKIDLGMFIKDNRDNERNGRFENNVERLILLKKLRSWNKTNGSVWNDKYNMCLTYETENKSNIISNNQKFKYNNKNFKPKEWLSDNKRTTITEERLILLKTLRTWSYICNKWDYMIKLCIDHENNKITELEEKKCVVLTNRGRKYWKIKELTKHGNIPIGKWFSTNAKKYKNNALRQTEKSTLENVKSLKYFIRNDWKHNYDLCIEYEAQNQGILASSKSKGPIGKNIMYKYETIGCWLVSQRTKKQKCKLPKQQLELLKLIKSF